MDSIVTHERMAQGAGIVVAMWKRRCLCSRPVCPALPRPRLVEESRVVNLNNVRAHVELYTPAVLVNFFNSFSQCLDPTEVFPWLERPICTKRAVAACPVRQ